MPVGMPVGVKKGDNIATAEDFAIDGVVPKSGADRRQAEQESRLQSRNRVLLAYFDAAVDFDLLGDRIEEPPAKMTRMTKLKIQCGCAAKEKFSMNLNQLERYTDEHGIEHPDEPYCPRCPSRIARQELQDIVEAKGGKIDKMPATLTSRVAITCAEGHTFSPFPNNVLYKGTWCQTCAVKKRARDAQERCEGILSERGWSLLDYNGSRDPLTASRNGEVREMRPQYLNHRPPMDKGGDAYELRYYHKDGYSFVAAGELIDLPPHLQEFIDTADAVHEGSFTHRCYDEMEHLIYLLGEIGSKVLNVWGNPQYISKDTYTWGTYNKEDISDV